MKHRKLSSLDVEREIVNGGIAHRQEDRVEGHALKLRLGRDEHTGTVVFSFYDFYECYRLMCFVFHTFVYQIVDETSDEH